MTLRVPFVVPVRVPPVEKHRVRELSVQITWSLKHLYEIVFYCKCKTVFGRCASHVLQDVEKTGTVRGIIHCLAQRKAVKPINVMMVNILFCSYTAGNEVSILRLFLQ